MAQLDTTQASAVLKTMFIGPIRRQVNEKTVLLKHIEREDQEVGGKDFTVPLHVGINESAGLGRGEGDDLPDAGSQQYKTAVVPIKYLYGRIKVSGQVMKAARSNAYAFIRAVDSETKGAVKNFRRALNRQLFGDGRDVLGVIAATVSNTNTGSVDDGKGNPFVHFQSGQTVDIYAAAAGALTSVKEAAVTITITGETSTAKTVGFSRNVTLADGDVIVPVGTWGKQMMGLGGIIDDGDPPLLSGGLHGLPVASNDYWKARVVRGTTPGTLEDLTLPRMQMPLSLLDLYSTEYDSSDVKFGVCNVFVRDKYLTLLTSLKRFVNTLELDGGFKGVEFNGLPIVVDAQSPRNQLLYPVVDSMKIYRTSDIEWMDDDGAILSRVPNKDQYEATLYMYADLAVQVRSANAGLFDIKE